MTKPVVVTPDVPIEILIDTVERMRAGALVLALDASAVVSPELKAWLDACNKIILEELEKQLRSRLQ